jgi:UDP-2,3-diacylglucosamine pyrophosphatase LpxH
MKKTIFFWLAVLASVLMFVFLGWAFSQHGTLGLFHVNGTFQKLFIILGVFGIVLLGLAFFERHLQSRREARSTHLLSAIVHGLTFLGIVIFVFAFFYIGMIPGPMRAGETPQLLIEDGSGINGVPNLAVTFRTQTLTSNTVKWGQAQSSFTLNETKSSQEHVFSLNDLQPDTGYWYQVNNGQKQYFNTPPVNGGSLHFAVGSDAHFGASDSRNDLTVKMLQQIADPTNKYNLFFSLGDLVEYGFKDAYWQEALNALSSTTSVIPVKYIVGNHDTLLGGLNRWESYCDPAVMPLQTGTQLWQRIDVGNIHFLVIDLEWSAENFNTAQSQWLEAQLASIPKDEWKIVVGHGFYYASGSFTDGWKWYDNPETINKLTPLFEKYNVDIVFSGHAHQLELLKKSGVSYVICGGFGGMLDTERQYVSPDSLWYAGGDYAFMDVTITGTNANLIFRDPDGNAINSFVVAKH